MRDSLRIAGALAPSQIGLQHRRVAAHFVRRSAGDPLTKIQDLHAIGDIHDDAHVMFDHQDGDAEFVANVEHEAGDVFGLFLVHAGDHFVQQQQLRLASERAGELHPFLLPVGQLPDDRIADLLDLQKFYDFLHLLARGDLLGAGATEEQRGLQHARFHMDMAADEDVVDDRAGLEQGQILEGAADAERREARGPLQRDVGAFEQNVPAGRSQHAADEIEERRLAGAVRSDHAANLAAGDVEAHVGNSAQAAEGARYGVEAEQRRGHDSHLLRRL